MQRILGINLVLNFVYVLQKMQISFSQFKEAKKISSAFRVHEQSKAWGLELSRNYNSSPKKKVEFPEVNGSLGRCSLWHHISAEPPPTFPGISQLKLATLCDENVYFPFVCCVFCQRSKLRKTASRLRGKNSWGKNFCCCFQVAKKRKT